MVPSHIGKMNPMELGPYIFCNSSWKQVKIMNKNVLPYL
jgi:hypothetical protein